MGHGKPYGPEDEQEWELMAEVCHVTLADLEAMDCWKADGMIAAIQKRQETEMKFRFEVAKAQITAAGMRVA